MNRIINEYGALRSDGVGEKATQIQRQFETKVRNLIQTHQLTPEEIRCLESCMRSSIFAEETLRTALKIKKERKVT